MKRLICITSILILLAVTAAWAQTTYAVRIVWDVNAASDAVVKYTVYEKAGGIYNKLQDVQASACGANECNAVVTLVAPGAHTYVVTATNYWESGYSNEASTPIPPGLPKNVRLVITVVITP